MESWDLFKRKGQRWEMRWALSWMNNGHSYVIAVHYCKRNKNLIVSQETHMPDKLLINIASIHVTLERLGAWLLLGMVWSRRQSF